MVTALIFAAALAANDYAHEDAWLCRPGRADACAVENTAAVIAADGTVTTEFWPTADAAAPIDCFYVYPTVSKDEGGNSDMLASHEERRVVEQQLARFGAKCRLFAPMYRQVTLGALQSLMLGRKSEADTQMAYGDVRDAWRHYLAHDNGGRGVVLIGHSQGARVLARLLAEEIDGKPAQKQLVSALLIGTGVPVEDGRYGSIPVCGAKGQTGCLISYASFRETAPPPPDSRFGKPDDPAKTAACVNPAELSGDGGALAPYLPTRSTTAPVQWLPKDRPVPEPPFVTLPGLLTARCVQADGFSYLSVKVHGDPADPRTDDIAGDVLVAKMVQRGWGLHLVDVNLAMGNLVAIVGEQAKAWTGSH